MEFKNFNQDTWLRGWLEEDIGSGDITTDSLVPAGLRTKAYIQAKSPGILAGSGVASRVFTLLDSLADVRWQYRDGEPVEPGAVLAEIAGEARAILSGERLALNLLQHLSGIATKTAVFASLAAPYGARIVDTRKTLPGLRLLEKYAVRAGGGHNHRLGLYDAMLIKDNHIKVAGSITAAIQSGRAQIAHTCRIEIEVESLAGAEEALQAGADIIMLDNMDIEQMKRAVGQIGGRALTEASGGIDERTVAAVAATGVDIISVGALTHSVQALDISLDIGAVK